MNYDQMMRTLIMNNFNATNPVSLKDYYHKLVEAFPQDQFKIQCCYLTLKHELTN